MDQPRPSTRGSIPNIDFENVRRESDQSSNRIISRSKSPLRNYKDNANNLSSSTTYNLTETYGTPFSKTQLLNMSQQKNRQVSNVTNTEPALKTYNKPSDIPRKLDSFKRAGSMQVTNISDISKEMMYSFIPPQSLQTICNGNNGPNPLAQSYDKTTSSGTNTFTSGLTSAGASTASYCKNCKRMEEQERILTYSLNQFLNQMNDVADKEKLWRQGAISCEVDNFGWNKEEDQSIDPRLLKKTDSGRLLVETKRQFFHIRKALEELILDVENLSKTNPYRDIQLLQKENRLPSSGDPNQMGSNPGRKLLSSIAEAKQYIESLKSVVFSEEIPPEIKDEIKSKTKRESEERNVLRALTLQLEQSKRERRVLEVELNLQKKGVLQNQNGINSSSLRQMIRQIIDEEITTSRLEN